MTDRGIETLGFAGIDIAKVLHMPAGKVRRVRSADGPSDSAPATEQGGQVDDSGSNLTLASVRRQILQQPLATAIGPLQAETGEQMTLHTRESLQLFLGRPAAAGQPAIAGGRRYAAAMRALWVLSGTDNPYADWILIRADDQLRAACEQMAQAVLQHEERLQRLLDQGLSFGRLASTQPALISLGFSSPYGYATARAIVEFDRYVRLIRAVVLRDLLTDEQGRLAVREAGRALRALFLLPIRWERVLMRDDLKALSRSDFEPGADGAANQRVVTAKELLGEPPAEVLSGRVKPRHSRRTAV